MMNLSSFRRYASYAGVVLAAAAAIATSSEKPAPATLSGDDQLTADAPEIAHHFSVTADESHSFAVGVQIAFDGVADGSDAEVLVRVTGDGATESNEQTVRFADFVAHGRTPSSALANASAGITCPSSPCNQGYTVLLKLQNGSATDHTGIHWDVTASDIDQTSSSPISVSEE